MIKTLIFLSIRTATSMPSKLGLRNGFEGEDRNDRETFWKKFSYDPSKTFGKGRLGGGFLKKLLENVDEKGLRLWRSPFWGLMPSFSFPQGFETGGKRKNEKTEGEVSDGVQDVKAQSHGDPREGFFKGKAVRDGLYGRI